MSTIRRVCFIQRVSLLGAEHAYRFKKSTKEAPLLNHVALHTRVSIKTGRYRYLTRKSDQAISTSGLNKTLI